MSSTVKKIRNRIEKGDVYYHADAKGFYRLIERGKEWSLCSGLCSYLSDSITTISRYLLHNTHIDGFGNKVTTMEQLEKVAEKIIDEKDNSDVNFRVKSEKDDLWLYWNPGRGDMNKAFLKKIDMDTNSLPEEIEKLDFHIPDRPDIEKRLANI